MIEGPAARRIGTVLRMREGDRFIVFGGDGKEWQACIDNVSRQRVHARIETLLRQSPAPKPHLEIAIGNVRSNRMDWALEKCVEAGADAIRALTSRYGQRGSGDTRGRRERWERVIIEAAEQCGRLDLPALLDPEPLETWLQRDHGHLCWGDPEGVAWDEAQRRLGGVPAVAFVVGPEGGFSQEELGKIRSAGGMGVRLAPNILRTETAAIAATTLVRSMPA